jgi:protein tyrosine phosphatase
MSFSGTPIRFCYHIYHAQLKSLHLKSVSFVYVKIVSFPFSDGVGRSGTYVLIDMVLNRMSKGCKEIDIAAALEHIR